MAIDNKDKKILNVPPLRFPEFTEEWKAEQLDNPKIRNYHPIHD